MTTKANAHFVDSDKGTGDGGDWTSGDRRYFPTVTVGYYPQTNGVATVSRFKEDNTLDTSWASSGHYIFPTSDWAFHSYVKTSDNGLVIGHEDTSGYILSLYVSTFSSASGTILQGANITTAGKGTADVVLINYIDASIGVIYWDSLVGDAFASGDTVTDGTNTVQLGTQVNANQATLTKLDSTGAIDTTWGYDGHLTTQANQLVTMWVDSSDNIYVGMRDSNREAIVKINASGVLQWSWSSGDAIEVFGLTEIDDNIICAIEEVTSGGSDYNVRTHDSTTGEIATSWGTGGYGAKLLSATKTTAYGIRKDSSDNLYLHTDSTTGSIVKLTSNGVIDITWGVDGFNGVGETAVLNSKFSYNNTLEIIDGVLFTISNPAANRKTVYVDSYDAIGTRKRLKTITTVGNDPIQCMSGGGGFVYLGGSNSAISGEGTSRLRYYTTDMTYIGNLTTVNVVNHIINTAGDNVPGAGFFGEQSRTVTYPEDHAHLNGQTVQVLGDASYLGTDVVTNGQIDLDDETTVNHVGLPYTSTILPMKLDGEVKVKRISKIIPNFHETVGGNYGRDSTDLGSMVLRASGDPLDTDSDLFTGHVDLPFDGTYDRSADIYITQTLPLPMKLLGIGVNLSQENI